MSTDVSASLLILAQDLLPMYRASLSFSDKALLRSLLLLDGLLSKSQPEGEESGAPPSFLKKTGYEPHILPYI